MAPPSLRFEDCFTYKIACACEFSAVQLHNGGDRLLVYAIAEMIERARFNLFGHAPTDQQRSEYAKLLMSPQCAFGGPIPEPPWKEWNEQDLPEGIFTNIRSTGADSIRIVMLFGATIIPSVVRARQSSMSDTAESHSTPSPNFGPRSGRRP